jgi:CheY-like chemotaxis protein
MKGAHKVLLVDDDDAVLKLEARILAAHGYEVREARSALEALGAVREEEPALVLIDLMMPGMSGLELCQRLRSDGRTAHLPVVFVTAKSAAGAAVAAAAAGGVRYLLKPFSAGALVSEVRRALGQSP